MYRPDSFALSNLCDPRPVFYIKFIYIILQCNEELYCTVAGRWPFYHYKDDYNDHIIWQNFSGHSSEKAPPAQCYLKLFVSLAGKSTESLISSGGSFT